MGMQHLFFTEFTADGRGWTRIIGVPLERLAGKFLQEATERTECFGFPTGAWAGE
jgi:hypothetical protein